MSDLIERQAAIDAMANTLWHCPNKCYRNLNEYEFAKGLAELGLKSVPSAQSDNRLSKIAELVEGTIDHFDLDDAMDLLYQIKEVVGNETSNI